MRFAAEPKRLIEEFFPQELNRVGHCSAHTSRAPNAWTWRARRPEETTRALVVLSCLPAGTPRSRFWNIFYQKESLSGELILDPMCGSGTTIRAASNVGARGIGGDISFLACVNALTSLSVDMEEIRQAIARISNEARWLFTTFCPFCGRPATVRYYFYGQTVTCSSCQKEVKQLPVYVDRWVRCACGSLATRSYCLGCNSVPRIQSPFSCPNCGDRPLRPVNPPRFHLEFVSGTCSYCGEFAKSADENDHLLLRRAEALLDNTEVFQLPLSKSWLHRRYKICSLGELLTPRGKLFLQMAQREAQHVKQKSYFLLFIANVVWRTMSRLSRFSPSGHLPFSGYLVYSPVFCEASPFVQRGAVSLVSRRPNQPAAKGSVYHGNAIALPFADNTFHAVITDPPFGDNHIQYSHMVDLAAIVSRLYQHYPWQPFENLMTGFFKEAKRVVRDGVIVFFFQSSRPSVWNQLSNALRASGLKVTAVWGVTNDLAISLGRKQPTADVIFVVRDAEVVRPSLEQCREEIERFIVPRSLAYGVALAFRVNWGESVEFNLPPRWRQPSLLE